ncbi:MAG: hypothetical protein RB294_10190, partial [Bacteroidales bacterium]|nr:hypothetical protein [Bacteroidales bacterium]
DLNTDPTIEELKQSTTAAPEPNNPSAPATDVETGPKPPEPNADDFAPKPPDPLPVQPGQLPTQAQPVAPMKKKLSAETSAQLIAGFEDSAQQLLLPILYTKYVFSTEEKIKIRELKMKRLTDPTFKPSNPVEEELLNRYKDYSDLKELLPMVAAEKQRLVETWDAIIKENPQMALSPWTALIMVHAEIFGPRLMPLLSRLSF